jgi:hypothetical protein
MCQADIDSLGSNLTIYEIMFVFRGVVVLFSFFSFAKISHEHRRNQKY